MATYKIVRGINHRNLFFVYVKRDWFRWDLVENVGVYETVEEAKEAILQFEKKKNVTRINKTYFITDGRGNEDLSW